jgi:hypothetical protein
MKIFDKAGVQGKWRAWVPIYNFMVFASSATSARRSCWRHSRVRRAEPGPGSRVDHRAAPGRCGCIGRVASRAEVQKETPWVILYVLLGLVWLGILAFDKSRWNTNVPPAPWAANSFPRRSHRLAGRSRSGVGGARKVHASGGLPAAGASGGHQPPAPPAPPAPRGHRAADHGAAQRSGAAALLSSIDLRVADATGPGGRGPDARSPHSMPRRCEADSAPAARPVGRGADPTRPLSGIVPEAATHSRTSRSRTVRSNCSGRS